MATQMSRDIGEQGGTTRRLCRAAAASGVKLQELVERCAAEGNGVDNAMDMLWRGESVCRINYSREYTVLVSMCVHARKDVDTCFKRMSMEDKTCTDIEVSSVQAAASRVLWLTSQLLSDHNAALYTCWQWRREALRLMILHTRNACHNRETKQDGEGDGIEAMILSWCRDELTFASSIAAASSKNYQVCHHRQEVIMMCICAIGDLLSLREKQKEPSSSTDKDDESSMENYYCKHTIVTTAAAVATSLCDDELDFVAAMLDLDSKNYHVWQHRIWIIQSLFAKCVDKSLHNEQSRDEQLASRLEKELFYTTEMIHADFNNNSAFMHRNIVKSALIGLGKTQLVVLEDSQLKHGICRLMDSSYDFQYRSNNNANDEPLPAAAAAAAAAVNGILRRNLAARRYFGLEDIDITIHQAAEDDMMEKLNAAPSQSAFHSLIAAMNAVSRE